MSLVTSKPVFGVFDQVRHKPACTATEASERLEILDIETRGIILSKQWTVLFAYGKNRFSKDMAQIYVQLC